VADFIFQLKKTLTLIALPPVGPVLLAMLGLALLRRRPRLGIVLVWAGLLVLVAVSLPVVSRALLASLETGEPLDPAQAKQADAIVIIAGGVRRDAREYGGDTVNSLSLDRVRYGAWLARRTGLPVLVSGGTVAGGAKEAEVMRDVLENELGVKVRWTEDRSRNTHENARYSAALLRESGVKRVVLVTHGMDMRRAGDEFRAAGLEVLSAPTGLPGAPGEAWREWVPGIGAFVGSYYALYEHLANAMRSLGLN
jgi:uncharacterized SAM-binding protein YcdF (DUF218 family)